MPRSGQSRFPQAQFRFLRRCLMKPVGAAVEAPAVAADVGPFDGELDDNPVECWPQPRRMPQRRTSCR